jgi:hypothetical protein
MNSSDKIVLIKKATLQPLCFATSEMGIYDSFLSRGAVMAMTILGTPNSVFKTARNPETLMRTMFQTTVAFNA